MDRQVHKLLMLIIILCFGLYFCPVAYANANRNLTSDESTNHIVAGMSETRDSLRKITSGLPSGSRSPKRSEKTALYYIGMPGYNSYRIP